MRGVRQPTRAVTSRLLVVDASVMAAAGAEGATDPVPAHAREAFKAILAICHRVCVSAALREEWRRHRSNFAQLWWRQMYARRKVVDGEPPSCVEILQDVQAFASITQSDRDAVEKDIHLIAAALAADQTVLSWDNRVAAIIRKVCADKRTLTSKAVSRMLWINPIADRETLHAWLSETGPAQPHWPLGAAVVPTAKPPRSSSGPMPRGKS